jgi:hypothetical protein
MREDLTVKAIFRLGLLSVEEKMGCDDNKLKQSRNEGAC